MCWDLSRRKVQLDFKLTHQLECPSADERPQGLGPLSDLTFPLQRTYL
jgi:hypothetical protein